MADVLTPNLKLRVSSSLSADSKYNLFKIDNLASLYQVDTNSVARIRSRRDIILQPNDEDIGGIGSGGAINLASVDHPADSVSIFTNQFNISAPVRSPSLVLTSGLYNISILAPVLSASYSLTLPTTTGTINQVLTTDGAGVLSWAAHGQEFTSTWTSGDGPTKTITHGLGTRSVIVEVMDSADSYKTVDVTVSRPTVNTVVLQSSATPGSWVVMLKQIP